MKVWKYANLAYLIENLFCAGTFQKILPYIAEAALLHADVKLSVKVVKVISGENSIKVRTGDEDELEFDEVVVTAPCKFIPFPSIYNSRIQPVI